ncbi:hypothetical protein ACQUFY_06330 [Robbsia andropogonis]|uniref:hypothetical protein n=1 Tax=Robbsia andropogonis TaxID=28092 RepID=UPI003D25A46E
MLKQGKEGALRYLTGNPSPGDIPLYTAPSAASARPVGCNGDEIMRTDTYDPELWQLMPKQMDRNMLLEWENGTYKAMLSVAPTPPALAQSEAKPASEWRTGTPPTKEGNFDEYIVAVQRKAIADRVSVFSAHYANNYGDGGYLCDRDGEAFIADGWYSIGEDPSGDFDSLFTPLLKEGDAVLGWQPLPTWDQAVPSAAPAQRVKQGYSDAATVLEELIEKMSDSIVESTDNLSEWVKGYNQSTKDTIDGLRARLSRRRGVMVDRYGDVIARVRGPSGKSVSYDDYAAMEAERDALAAQVKRLNTACVTWEQRYEAIKGTLAALAAQVEALKEYAERYQWVRRTFIADDEIWPDDVAEANTGEQLDVAIDAAREQKQ